MTLDTSKDIAAQLRILASAYLEHEQTVIDFDVSDMLMQNAAQLHFVAVLTQSAHDGHYDAMGSAWVAAARRLLDALKERARMDAVHESRASRRVAKAAEL